MLGVCVGWWLLFGGVWVSCLVVWGACGFVFSLGCFDLWFLFVCIWGFGFDACGFGVW